jgi:hypothetical protein
LGEGKMTDATMNREEIAVFLAAMKKLRDGLYIRRFQLLDRRHRRRWDASWFGVQIRSVSRGLELRQFKRAPTQKLH